MNLVKWVDRDYPNFSDELDNVLAGFFPVVRKDRWLGNITLSGELSEDEKNIYATFDIPAGVSKDNLKIVLENGILSISGEKQESSKVEGRKYYKSERNYGSFSRRFSLPSEVDEQNVQAKFDEKHHLLELTMPKSEKSKAKAISISAK